MPDTSPYPQPTTAAVQRPQPPAPAAPRPQAPVAAAPGPAPRPSAPPSTVAGPSRPPRASTYTRKFYLSVEETLARSIERMARLHGVKEVDIGRYWLGLQAAAVDLQFRKEKGLP